MVIVTLDQYFIWGNRTERAGRGGEYVSWDCRLKHPDGISNLDNDKELEKLKDKLATWDERDWDGDVRGQLVLEVRDWAARPYEDVYLQKIDLGKGKKYETWSSVLPLVKWVFDHNTEIMDVAMALKPNVNINQLVTDKYCQMMKDIENMIVPTL